MMSKNQHRKFINLGVLAAIMLFTSFYLQAQQDRYNWRFGLGVGNQYTSGNPYNGDSMTSNGIIEVNPAFYSYSAFLELSLSQSFGLRLFTNTRPQDYVLTNSGLLLSYYFDTDYLFGSKAIIAPYLTVGAAYGENQNTFNLPFGGGIKFRLSSRVNINVDYTARTYTDRWNKSDFNFGNELGGYSSISVHYNFGKKPRSYNAPQPYVSPYAQPQATAQKTKPTAPVVVEKEIEVVTTIADTVSKGASDIVVSDTNVTTVVDTVAFMKTPIDSAGKAQFLNRYGKILKTPILGDSSRSLSFESIVYDSIGNKADIKVDSTLMWGTVPNDLKSSQAGAAKANSKNYPDRDSTLQQLEFEIKRQKLTNELKLLRKAENDSTVTALRKENEMLRSQLRPGGTTNSESENTVQSQPGSVEVTTTSTNEPASSYPTTTGTAGSTYTGSNYQPNTGATTTGTAATGAVVGGAVAGGVASDNVRSLEAKVDTLQRQLMNLQRILLAQKTEPVAIVASGTKTAEYDSAGATLDTLERDSLGTDTLAIDTGVVDTLGISTEQLPGDTVVNKPIDIDTVDYATESDLKSIKDELAKTKREVDSLMNVKPQAPAIPPAPEKEAKPIKKTFFETTGKAEVFFDIGSSTLNSESRKKLDDMIEYAKSKPGSNFLLKGYTDKTGSIAINKALSDKRAKAVQQYITAKGVSAERLKVMSIGPDQSLTEGSQSYGRRVEVVLN